MGLTVLLCELRTCSDSFDSLPGPVCDSDDFWGLRAQSIFSSILRKISVRFQSASPETNLQIKTAAEIVFTRKSSIQFYFIISQTRILQQAGIQDLPANLNFYCLKNMYPCQNT
jgi:hypothetical protein